MLTLWMLCRGGPAATYFLCFAKESRQRKATALPLPLRGSRLCKSKNGKYPELASQAKLKQGYFFIHFLPRTNGSSTAERQKQHRISNGYLSENFSTYLRGKKRPSTNLVSAHAGRPPSAQLVEFAQFGNFTRHRLHSLAHAAAQNELLRAGDIVMEPAIAI